MKRSLVAAGFIAPRFLGESSPKFQFPHFNKTTPVQKMSTAAPWCHLNQIRWQQRPIDGCYILKMCCSCCSCCSCCVGEFLLLLGALCRRNLLFCMVRTASFVFVIGSSSFLSGSHPSSLHCLFQCICLIVDSCGGLLAPGNLLLSSARSFLEVDLVRFDSSLLPLCHHWLIGVFLCLWSVNPTINPYRISCWTMMSFGRLFGVVLGHGCHDLSSAPICNWPKQQKRLQQQQQLDHHNCMHGGE